MKVKCINDDWSTVQKGSVGDLVLKVGDPMPVKGNEYEVIGHGHYEGQEDSYELAGLDYSNYPGGRMLFKKSRFEIVDDTFIPNMVLGEEHGLYAGTPAREMNMYMSFSFPAAKIGKMPRKKKKAFKKYGMTFTHSKYKLLKP